MTAAMILPRFSELCKEIYVTKQTQESLTLAPLRIDAVSRNPPSSPSTDSNIHPRRRSLPVRDSSGNGVHEMQSSPYDHSYRVCDESSGESSPEEDHSSGDEDTDAEQYHGQQYRCESVLFKPSHPRGEAPALGQPRVKKVKYHICEICQKAFPRPSGLRAHMNMHTKEKPFECGFPGCPKRFSVSSNAKRHLRTHGVGLSPSDEPLPLPYVVDFEEPVVVPNEGDDSAFSSAEPLNLRWMPLGAGSRRSYRQRNPNNHS